MLSGDVCMCHLQCVGKCWRKTVLMVGFVRRNLLLRMHSSCAGATRADTPKLKTRYVSASGLAADAFLLRCWCDIAAAAAATSVVCEKKNGQSGSWVVQVFTFPKDGNFSFFFARVMSRPVNHAFPCKRWFFNMMNWTQQFWKNSSTNDFFYED